MASVLTGARLGAYHLQERIGAGGMGMTKLHLVTNWFAALPR